MLGEKKPFYDTTETEKCYCSNFAVMRVLINYFGPLWARDQKTSNLNRLSEPYDVKSLWSKYFM